jgi:hypothetical protein
LVLQDVFDRVLVLGCRATRLGSWISALGGNWLDHTEGDSEAGASAVALAAEIGGEGDSWLGSISSRRGLELLSS